MTDTRAQLAMLADYFVGYESGRGFDIANRFSADLGRPTESWCADFVTDIYRMAGLPLPSMQLGCRTGFAGVESAWSWAHARGLLIPSWDAQLADVFLFRFPSSWHTEICVAVHDGYRETVGGNSGPGGGVNRHTWSTPPGTGNSEILGVIDMSRVVTFAPAPLQPVPAPRPPTTGPRLLMLKTPYLSGPDVAAVQAQLNAHGNAHLTVDGIYGPLTVGAVVAFQLRMQLDADGIVGPLTRSALGLAG